MKPKRQASKPLLLLDRDGTLIEEKDYLSDPKKVRILPGVTAALRRLKKAGYKMAVISNQSGVARGLITLDQLHRVNKRFLALLRAQKASVDGLYWCPHAPAKNCSCRKPKLGLVKRAAKEIGVPWRGSISVGDRPSDIEMGQRTGGQGILVLTGYGKQWAKKSGADFVVKNFREAAAIILTKT